MQKSKAKSALIWIAVALVIFFIIMSIFGLPLMFLFNTVFTVAQFDGLLFTLGALFFAYRGLKKWGKGERLAGLMQLCFVVAFGAAAAWDLRFIDERLTFIIAGASVLLFFVYKGLSTLNGKRKERKAQKTQSSADDATEKVTVDTTAPAKSGSLTPETDAILAKYNLN